MNAASSSVFAEAALVARAQAGDRLAFEGLVRLHADRLVAAVQRLVGDRHEAEEATPEAFLATCGGDAPRPVIGSPR